MTYSTGSESNLLVKQTFAFFIEQKAQVEHVRNGILKKMEWRTCSTAAVNLVGCPLQNDRHRLVVVTLNLLIGYPAVLLSGFYPAVPQKILYRYKIRIGVEHLGGHRVPVMPISA